MDTIPCQELRFLPGDFVWHQQHPHFVAGAGVFAEASGGKLILTDAFVEISGGKLILTDVFVEISGGKLKFTDGFVEESGGKLKSADGFVEVSGGKLKFTACFVKEYFVLSCHRILVPSFSPGALASSWQKLGLVWWPDESEFNLGRQARQYDAVEPFCSAPFFS